MNHILTPRANAKEMHILFVSLLSMLVAQDIGVTGIKDGEGATSEEFTTGCSQLNLLSQNVSITGPSKVKGLLLWASCEAEARQTSRSEKSGGIVDVGNTVGL